MRKMNREEFSWVEETEYDKMGESFYLKVKFQVEWREIVYVRFKVLLEEEYLRLIC